MTPYILLILGLVLIFFEFYIPGAIMGTLGGLLVFASLIMITTQSTSLLEIFLFYIGTALAIYGLIKFALWRIPRTKGAFSIYSDKDQEGYQASKYDPKAIGKKGTVLSDLKPGGYIVIEGEQHQALSQSGYLPKGTEVLVLGGEGESLIVKKV